MTSSRSRISNWSRLPTYIRTARNPHFLDQESYETLTLNDGMMGNALDFLIEGALLQLHKYNGNPIGLQLPMFVELNVAYAEPAARGDFFERQRDQGGQAGDWFGDFGSALHQRRGEGEGVDGEWGVFGAGVSWSRPIYHKVRDGQGCSAKCRYRPAALRRLPDSK